MVFNKFIEHIIPKYKNRLLRNNAVVQVARCPFPQSISLFQEFFDWFIEILRTDSVEEAGIICCNSDYFSMLCRFSPACKPESNQGILGKVNQKGRGAVVLKISK